MDEFNRFVVALVYRAGFAVDYDLAMQVQRMCWQTFYGLDFGMKNPAS